MLASDNIGQLHEPIGLRAEVCRLQQAADRT